MALVEFGLVWLSLVWCGQNWFSLVKFCFVCFYWVLLGLIEFALVEQKISLKSKTGIIDYTKIVLCHVHLLFYLFPFSWSEGLLDVLRHVLQDEAVHPGGRPQLVLLSGGPAVAVTLHHLHRGIKRQS